MKKYICDMTKDELRNVWEANARLQEKVATDFADNEMMWIEELIGYSKNDIQKLIDNGGKMGQYAVKYDDTL